MKSAQLELIFLALAISLSLPRFFNIFSIDQSSKAAVPLATMISSAVFISSFGLAFVDHGLLSGIVIALLGVLISRAAGITEAPIVTLQATIFLAIYLQARSALP